MKIEKLTFKEKGKVYSGEIAWPDSLQLAIALLGERGVWEAFKLGYRQIVRARIVGKPILPRKKIVKLDVSLLDEQSRAVIEQIAAMQAGQQQQQPELESAQPEQQHKDHSDYVEKPEAAQAPSSQSESSSEEDFSKYLASLDS